MNGLLSPALLIWLLFLPIAIVNGIVREAVYAPVVGALAAHQISTVLAIAAFFALAYFLLKGRMAGVSGSALWTTGVLWVVLTVVFEFSFGHYVAGASWERLLADYNLFEGRVWGVFLVALLLTPQGLNALKQGRKGA